jgi:hypothetical protein
MTDPRFNRSLNILGTEFQVYEENDMDETDAGESNATTRHIAINQHLIEDTKLETFYHEVVHMMLALGGYDNLLGTNEEAFVQYLGMALTHFLSENSNLPVRTGSKS